MEITQSLLTPTEYKACKLLAEGRSYRIVEQECGILRAKIPAFMAQLRRKTGIRDLKDAPSVRAYMENAELSASVALTEKEREVLIKRVGLHGSLPHSWGAVALKLKMTEDEARTLYSDALLSIGIFSVDARTQRAQVRQWHVLHGPVPRLSEKQWSTLRTYAQEGAVEDHLQQMLFHTLSLLGIRSRGRGAQLRLAQLAIARHDAQAASAPIAPSMDDPLF